MPRSWGGRLCIEKDVCIRNNFVIVIQKTGKVEIGANTDIGQSSRIGCQGHIKIGKEVLTGPNVFIADYNHEYRDISRSVLRQGNHFISVNGRPNIEIGDGTWIGMNVVIVGNVLIGKHCVIGANTVVTKDVPDYCVVAGSPARIIKRYNQETQMWEKA